MTAGIKSAYYHFLVLSIWASVLAIIFAVSDIVMPAFWLCVWAAMGIHLSDCVWDKYAGGNDP